MNNSNAQLENKSFYDKRRLINFRAFLVIFVAIILAIFCGVIASFFSAVGLILFIVVTTIATIFILYLRRTEISFYKIVVLLISVGCFVVTFLNIFITTARWNSINANGTYEAIKGEISQISKIDDAWTITLKNVYINGAPIRGKINLYIIGSQHENLTTDIDVGYKVSANLSISSTKLVDEGLTINSKYKRSNVRYYSSVRESDSISFLNAPKPLLATFRDRIKLSLSMTMGEKYGGLAYSMLTGDKNDLSTDLKVTFGVSGIGHVLAVSGLHIAILSLLLIWIFSKVGFRRRLIVVFLNLFYLFYLFLADFSPSVIRAVITYEVFLIVRYAGFWRDSLSTLAFAASLILLFSPFSLFDGGFILSFSAVFSLILFTRPVRKIVDKLKLPVKLSEGLSASIAVQLGIVPAIITLYNEIQVYSILTNVILLPLVSIVFSGVFVFLVLTLILPFMGIFLTLFGSVFYIIDFVVRNIARLPFAIIIYSSFGLILIYACLFFISRFYMKRKRISVVKIVSIVASLVLLLNGVFNMPKWQARNDYIIPVDDYGFVTSIVKSNDRTYLVGDCSSIFKLEETLNQARITKIDAVYLTLFNEGTVKALINLYYRYNVKTIYMPNSIYDPLGVEILIQSSVSIPILIDASYDKDGFTLVYDNASNFLGYKQKTNYTSILYLGRKSRLRLVDTSIINECAIIRMHSHNELYNDRIQLTQFDVFKGERLSTIFAVDTIGSYVFDFSSGIVYAL